MRVVERSQCFSGVEVRVGVSVFGTQFAWFSGSGALPARMVAKCASARGGLTHLGLPPKNQLEQSG